MKTLAILFFSVMAHDYNGKPKRRKSRRLEPGGSEHVVVVSGNSCRLMGQTVFTSNYFLRHTFMARN